MVSPVNCSESVLTACWWTVSFLRTFPRLSLSPIRGQIFATDVAWLLGLLLVFARVLQDGSGWFFGFGFVQSQSFAAGDTLMMVDVFFRFVPRLGLHDVCKLSREVAMERAVCCLLLLGPLILAPGCTWCELRFLFCLIDVVLGVCLLFFGVDRQRWRRTYVVG